MGKALIPLLGYQWVSLCSFIHGWSEGTWDTQDSICGSVTVLTLIASDTGPFPSVAGRSSAKLGMRDMEGMVLLQLCQALQVRCGTEDHDGPWWSCWLLVCFLKFTLIQAAVCMLMQPCSCRH